MLWLEVDQLANPFFLDQKMCFIPKRIRSVSNIARCRVVILDRCMYERSLRQRFDLVVKRILCFYIRQKAEQKNEKETQHERNGTRPAESANQQGILLGLSLSRFLELL